jgi:hypothetical protein
MILSLVKQTLEDTNALSNEVIAAKTHVEALNTRAEA